MKVIYSLLFSIFSILSYSQSGLDYVHIKCFTIKGNMLLCANHQINSLEKTFGKFKLSENDEIVLFTKKSNGKIAENENISFF